MKTWKPFLLLKRFSIGLKIKFADNFFVSLPALLKSSHQTPHSGIQPCVRNTVIGMFNPLDLRADAGEIWENYVFSERLKRNEYLRRGARMYFWRTYNRKEIDLVEEEAGKLNGFEIKWRSKKVKAPKDWTRHYPEAGYKVIHTDNYLDFITAP